MQSYITYSHTYNRNASYITRIHIYIIQHSTNPSTNIKQVHTSHKSTIPTSNKSIVHETSSQVQHARKEVTTAATRRHLHLKEATKSTRTVHAEATRWGPPNRSKGAAEEGSSPRRPRAAAAEEFRHPEARSTYEQEPKREATQENGHLEKELGSNSPSVPAQRRYNLISTYMIAAHAKTMDKHIYSPESPVWQEVVERTSLRAKEE